MDTKLLSAYIEQYHHSDPEAMENVTAAAKIRQQISVL